MAGEWKMTISFTWVAGHQKLVGNERADTLAKEASANRSSPEQNLLTFLQHQLLISISAIKQAINADIKKEMKKWWKSLPRFENLSHIDPSLPLNKYLNITSSLNCRQTSVLTQLCTGHAPINKHLHQIGKNALPYCPQATCMNITEDLHHILFTCPQYTQARYHLTCSIGRKNFTTKKLLAD